MPKVNGWFETPPELPWERESVAFLYDSQAGPEYYSYPMTGLVPQNEPHASDLESAPSPLWIAYLDGDGQLGKQDSKGDKTFRIPLPHSFDVYLQSLPYNHRKELRNNLRRNKDVLVVENKKSDIDIVWDHHVHKIQSITSVEGESAFSKEGLLLLRELFQSPLVYTLSLYIEDKLYGVNISFHRATTVFDSTCIRLDADTVRSRGLGSFAILKNIEYAIRDGFKTYDMLTGDWGYKHKFGAKPCHLKHYLKCSASFANAYGIPIDEVSELLES